jgi:hypothetical protein
MHAVSTVKIGRSVFVAGALMIAAAILSAIFGFYLLSAYRMSLVNGHFVPTDYPSLFMGVFNLVAVGLDLFGAMLLLLRKHIGLAVTLTGFVLAFGVAAPFVTNFANPSHYSFVDASWTLIMEQAVKIGLLGLLYGLPLIVFSVPTLIITKLKLRKMQNAYGQWPKVSFMAAGALMVTASMVSAYSGLEILFGNNAFVFTHASWSYFGPAVMAILDLVIFPVAMAAGVRLIKRKQTSLAAAFSGLVLAFMVAVTTVGGFIPFDAFVFGAFTIVASIGALTIVGLNYRRFQQSTITVCRQNINTNQGEM